MTRYEQDLLNSESALERERLRILAQEQRLRHERRSRGIKAFLLLGFTSMILFLVLPPLVNSYNQWRDRVAAEEAAKQAQHQATTAAMDRAWQTCITTQGLEACTLLERRTLLGCYQGEWHDEKTVDCIKKRLEDMGALE